MENENNENKKVDWLPFSAVLANKQAQNLFVFFGVR